MQVTHPHYIKFISETFIQWFWGSRSFRDENYQIRADTDSEKWKNNNDLALFYNYTEVAKIQQKGHKPA